MLEVEPTGQHGSITTGNSQDDLDFEKIRRQYLDNENRYDYC